MKSLSYPELKSFATWLQPLIEGAQLQNIWTNGEVIVFEFYKKKNIWLCLDMTQNFPQILYLEKNPSFKKIAKPITVFLNAHAKNLRWLSCDVPADKGRILEFELGSSEKSCFLEFIAVPRVVNLIAKSEGKSISWEKPREMPPSQIMEQKLEAMDWTERGLTWLIEKNNPVKSNTEQPTKKDPRIKNLEKKKLALEKIQMQLRERPEDLWKELGEHLKSSVALTNEDLNPKFHEIYNFKISKAENREKAFNKYKDLKRKKIGTEERVLVLRQEIADLENQISSHSFDPSEVRTPTAGAKILAKTKSRGRKLELDEGIEAIIGKSAKDNLAILRQAHAWDLWMHLKDYPGAHAVILRPKGKEVPIRFLEKVAQWLIAESFGGKKNPLSGKYDVVVVECRHVRPIKGDKLGRVSYHNPQTFSFASKS